MDWDDSLNASTKRSQVRFTSEKHFSFKCPLQVKPQDVVLNLRAQEVTTHTMSLSWGPPIRLIPINYKISYNAYKEFVDAQGITQSAMV